MSIWALLIKPKSNIPNSDNDYIDHHKFQIVNAHCHHRDGSDDKDHARKIRK